MFYLHFLRFYLSERIYSFKHCKKVRENVLKKFFHFAFSFNIVYHGHVEEQFCIIYAVFMKLNIWKYLFNKRMIQEKYRLYFIGLMKSKLI